LEYLRLSAAFPKAACCRFRAGPGGGWSLTEIDAGKPAAESGGKRHALQNACGMAPNGQFDFR
jgi:hypothetical protein